MAEKRSSILQRLGSYGVFCIVLVLSYIGIELRGWGFQPGAREQVPMSVRQSPGGYRSYHFWHRGLHGGK
jgi:hypothetical protein